MSFTATGTTSSSLDELGRSISITVLRTVLSTIFSASSHLTAGIPIAPGVIQTVGEQVRAVQNKRDKARDGYGVKMNDGKFAKNEGGILICMPSAKGPMYAHDRNHLPDDVEDSGRLDTHRMGELKDSHCFFPTRKKDGTMDEAAKADGVIHIIAFDSNYADNLGLYEVSLQIMR